MSTAQSHHQAGGSADVTDVKSQTEGILIPNPRSAQLRSNVILWLEVKIFHDDRMLSRSDLRVPRLALPPELEQITSHPVGHSHEASGNYYQNLDELVNHKAGLQLPGVWLPPTVLFEMGLARALVFSDGQDDEHSEIVRRTGKALNLKQVYIDCLKTALSISPEDVVGEQQPTTTVATPSTTAPYVEPHHADLPVAEFHKVSSGDHACADTQVRYLNPAELYHFLYFEKSRGTGLLQAFVRPSSETYNAVIQMTWTPHLVIADQRQNRHKLAGGEKGVVLEQRCVTYDGPDSASVLGVPSRGTKEQCEKVCRRLVKVYGRGSRSVARLVVYFKTSNVEGSGTRVWLLRVAAVSYASHTVLKDPMSRVYTVLGGGRSGGAGAGAVVKHDGSRQDRKARTTRGRLGAHAGAAVASVGFARHLNAAGGGGGASGAKGGSTRVRGGGGHAGRHGRSRASSGSVQLSLPAVPTVAVTATPTEHEEALLQLGIDLVYRAKAALYTDPSADVVADLPNDRLSSVVVHCLRRGGITVHILNQQEVQLAYKGLHPRPDPDPVYAVTSAASGMVEPSVRTIAFAAGSGAPNAPKGDKGGGGTVNPASPSAGGGGAESLSPAAAAAMLGGPFSMRAQSADPESDGGGNSEDGGRANTRGSKGGGRLTSATNGPRGRLFFDPPAGALIALLQQPNLDFHLMRLTRKRMLQIARESDALSAV